jgi:transposase
MNMQGTDVMTLLAGAANARQDHTLHRAQPAERQAPAANEISKADFQRRVPPAASKGAPSKPRSAAVMKKINAKKTQKQRQ